MSVDRLAHLNQYPDLRDAGRLDRYACVEIALRGVDDGQEIHALRSAFLSLSNSNVHVRQHEDSEAYCTMRTLKSLLRPLLGTFPSDDPRSLSTPATSLHLHLECPFAGASWRLDTNVTPAEGNETDYTDWDTNKGPIPIALYLNKEQSLPAGMSGESFADEMGGILRVADGHTFFLHVPKGMKFPPDETGKQISWQDFHKRASAWLAPGTSISEGLSEQTPRSRLIITSNPALQMSGERLKDLDWDGTLRETGVAFPSYRGKSEPDSEVRAEVSDQISADTEV